MGRKIVHFEIAGPDGDALEEFYGQLFGWQIDRRDAGGSPYGFIRSGDAGFIDGGIRHEPEGTHEVVFYVEVPDVEQAVEEAKNLGASVRIPPMTTPDLIFALLVDPQGNPVGLIQTKAIG